MRHGLSRSVAHQDRVPKIDADAPNALPTHDGFDRRDRDLQLAPVAFDLQLQPTMRGGANAPAHVGGRLDGVCVDRHDPVPDLQTRHRSRIARRQRPDDRLRIARVNADAG